MNTPKHIAIIGGGAAGLAAAYFLLKKDYRVTIYEPLQPLGGLANTIAFSGARIERFFHHFFATDTDLIALIDELGLADDVHWFKSHVGFWRAGIIHHFDTPFDVLRFAPLTIKNRILLALSILYFKYKRNYRDLEQVSIANWYARLGGTQIFDVVWKPLLISKFGKHNYERISAAWLWGRIHPRVRSRGKGGEQLGYLKGSMQHFFNTLAAHVRNAKVVTEPVTRLDVQRDSVTITTTAGLHQYDAVIVTAPLVVLEQIMPDAAALLHPDHRAIRYQGVVCMLLELDRPLSDRYWLNIIDERVTLAGVIEHTNFAPREWYNHHLVYLFNYVDRNDALYALSDDELHARYIADLRLLFPQFNAETIRSSVINRTPFATPIYEGEYSRVRPPIRLDERIFLATTAQIYPEDRNVSNAIKTARNAVDALTERL